MPLAPNHLPAAVKSSTPNHLHSGSKQHDDAVRPIFPDATQRFDMYLSMLSAYVAGAVSLRSSTMADDLSSSAKGAESLLPSSIEGCIVTDDAETNTSVETAYGAPASSLRSPANVIELSSTASRPSPFLSTDDPCPVNDDEGLTRKYRSYKHPFLDIESPPPSSSEEPGVIHDNKDTNTNVQSVSDRGSTNQSENSLLNHKIESRSLKNPKKDYFHIIPSPAYYLLPSHHIGPSGPCPVNDDDCLTRKYRSYKHPFLDIESPPPSSSEEPGVIHDNKETNTNNVQSVSDCGSTNQSEKSSLNHKIESRSLKNPKKGYLHIIPSPTYYLLPSPGPSNEASDQDCKS